MPELTIMGAGVFGLALGCIAARRGARVRLIERHNIAAGSSGGIVGALAPHVPENWNPKKAFQFDSLRMSGDFWGWVEQVSERDTGYARLGRVQPVPEGGEALAQARAVGAKKLWQGYARWDVVKADEASGLHVISPSGLVIHDDLSARLHPRKACVALAAAFEALGGDLVIGDAPALRGAVVWATGHDGLIDLGRDLGREVGTGVKGQAVLLRHDARSAPQVFADGLHVVPHGDGTVAIGSTSERHFSDPSATDDQCDALIARAIAACPDLAQAEIIGRWAGVRPRARSRAPMLGGWPGRDGEFVFNGGFKIGFGMVPLLAEVMADLVLDGFDRVPEGFRVADNL